MVSLTLDARTVYSLFKGYILKWIWPSRYYTAHLASIFEESRAKSHRAANHVKCQASDIMAMMPILAQFTSDILLPSGVCTRECQTFLKFCDMAEFITSVNRGGVLHTQISDTVHSFLAAFVATWGVSYLIPKFHWRLHFGLSFQRWGTLLACFVNERYHKNPKQYASDLKNTSSKPGLSLLKEVVCHQLASVQAPGALDFSIGLIKPISKPSRADYALIEGALELDLDTVSVYVHHSKMHIFDQNVACTTVKCTFLIRM